MSASRPFTGLGGDELLLRLRVGEGELRLFAGGVEGGRTLRLVGQAVGGVDVLADEVLELLLDRGLVVALRELPRVLGGLFGEGDDRLADVLAGLVAEHDGAEHLVFRKLLGFGFDHHHGVRSAGDDEVEAAFRDLLPGSG